MGAVSVMSVSGAFAALVCGVVAEKISAKLLLTLAYVLGAVSMWVLMRADTLPETYMFAVLQGSAGSGVNTLESWPETDRIMARGYTPGNQG